VTVGDENLWSVDVCVLAKKIDFFKMKPLFGEEESCGRSDF
jgi:hypothetical protein